MGAGSHSESSQAGAPLAVETRPIEGGVIVALTGELDLASARRVEDELRQASQSHHLVVVDLRQVTFIDSSGLHALIDAETRLRDRGGRLILVQGPPQVRRLLKLTGAAERIEIVSDPARITL